MPEADEADWREIDRFPNGVGWFAEPAEAMRRASHLLVDGGVWLLDLVIAEGLDGLVAEFGEVAGVAVLLDRHRRDAATLARRYGVAVHLPTWFDGVAERLDAPVERYDDALPGTDFEAIPLVNNRLWQEVALFDGETLVVPEALGTASVFTAGDRTLGVHPGLRLWPPRRRLGGLEPERVMVGHGEGVFEDAGDAVAEALAGSRRRAPRVYVRSLLDLLR